MANPRKFSEKIALHNQKQAEETAAFERIMQEVSVVGIQPPPRGSTVHLTPHPQGYLRSYLGGSLPNVNQIAANPQMELHHPSAFESKHPVRHAARFDTRMRPYGPTHRRPMELTNRHRMDQFDGSPGQYPGPFLSPPPESSWRSFALSRTNSDSALHQSVMNPNSQDSFNPSHNQMNYHVRRDLNENNFINIPPSYKQKFDQIIINRPKSCEAPNISLVPSVETSSRVRTGADVSPLSVGSNGTVPIIPTTPGLSHVTQLGNNTGSLPDLTNLHIPSPLSNPLNDYDESQHPPLHSQPGGPNAAMYISARSTGNLPAASAISPHLGMSRGPASPNRSRRHTHNGPSPLSLSSPEHARRMKYSNMTSPKMSGVKSELKSPPLGGSYTYPYPPFHPGQRGGVPAGSMHAPQMPPPQHPAGAHPLHIDISAASKTPYNRVSTHGPSMRSPLTSPTSPASHMSQPNFSPVTSPHHEFTTGSNPALSEAYYRADMSSMQPLQHQFEQFHVVGDHVNSHHPIGAPLVYSNLTTLAENSTDEFNSGYLSGGLQGMNNFQGSHDDFSNNLSRIPDIVFSGVDDGQGLKYSSEPSTDYYPGDELKAHLGLDELHMLEDSNIINDPVMEDTLRLDSL